MHAVENGILLIVVVAAGTVAARRLRVEPSILLVLVGVVLSMLPGVPQFHLDPELVLVLILPPLLYAAACATSPTTTVLNSVSPTASSRIGRRLARKAGTELRDAAPYSSGGRISTSTTCGSRWNCGTPGTIDSTTPTSTSRIDGSIRSRRAATVPAATTTISRMPFSSACMAPPPLPSLPRLGQHRQHMPSPAPGGPPCKSSG